MGKCKRHWFLFVLCFSFNSSAHLLLRQSTELILDIPEAELLIYSEVRKWLRPDTGCVACQTSWIIRETALKFSYINTLSRTHCSSYFCLCSDLFAQTLKLTGRSDLVVSYLLCQNEIFLFTPSIWSRRQWALSGYCHSVLMSLQNQGS